MITLLSNLLKNLAALVAAFFAGRQAGRKDAEYDYNESLKKILAEDAQDWANRPADRDAAIKRLRDEASRRR
jgi:hypothetical protein